MALEHRFYGESIPTAIPTPTIFITYRADLNAFTSWFTASFSSQSKSTLSSANPWFVFGGSHPGALSSWYRYVYPQASVGSLSSSGVTNCIIDYYQFDQQVSAAIGNKCADGIKRIEKAFENKIFSSDGINTAG